MVNNEINEVLKTTLLFFSVCEKRKNAVSRPYVRIMTKNATYAYNSVTTPYSSGKKYLV